MKPLSTVAIVGVGLIGGSIGLALRQRKLAGRVIGIGRRQESLRAARRVGAVDHTTIDMEKGVAEAELVVVCTPVGRIAEDVRKAAEHCPEGAILTDTGSTKQTIVAELDQGLGAVAVFWAAIRWLAAKRPGQRSPGPICSRAASPSSLPRKTRGPKILIFWRDFGRPSVRL